MPTTPAPITNTFMLVGSSVEPGLARRGWAWRGYRSGRRFPPVREADIMPTAGRHEDRVMWTNALLTVEEMYRADAAAVAAGVPSLSLMEAAGRAIAREIRRRWRPRPLVVLCGPGNNGGDGFVVARVLAGEGWPLRGGAAVNARRWRGPLRALDRTMLEGDPLIVDALFGAGLARPLDGTAAEL